MPNRFLSDRNKYLLLDDVQKQNKLYSEIQSGLLGIKGVEAEIQQLVYANVSSKNTLQDDNTSDISPSENKEKNRTGDSEEHGVGAQGLTAATGALAIDCATGEVVPKIDAGAQGPTGATGQLAIDGATGEVGPKGDVGAQGPTGATGPQGVAGKTGSHGPGVLFTDTGGGISIIDNNSDNHITLKQFTSTFPLLLETVNSEIMVRFQQANISDTGKVLTYQHGESPMWIAPVSIINEYISKHQSGYTYSTSYINKTMGWCDFIEEQQKVVTTSEFVICSYESGTKNLVFHKTNPVDSFVNKIGSVDFTGSREASTSYECVTDDCGDLYARIFAEMEVINDGIEIGNLVFFVLSKDGYSSSSKILELKGDSVSVNVHGDLKILPTWESIGENGTRMVIFESDLSGSNITPAAIHAYARDTNEMLRKYSSMETFVGDNDNNNMWSYLSFSTIQGGTEPTEILRVGGVGRNTQGVVVNGTCLVDVLKFSDGTSMATTSDLYSDTKDLLKWSELTDDFALVSLLKGSWGNKSIICKQMWDKSCKGWGNHAIGIKLKVECVINEFTIWIQEVAACDEMYDAVTLKIYGSNNASSITNGEWYDLNINSKAWLYEALSYKKILKNNKYIQGWVFKTNSSIENYRMYKLQCIGSGVLNPMYCITFDYKSMYESDYV